MKNNNVNQLDQLFSQGLGDAETSPPSASWAQMEALLDAQPKQKKRAAAWWWAAAAAILPLLIAGLWWIMKPQDSDSQMAVKKPKATEQTLPSKIESTPKMLLDESIATPNTVNSIAASDHKNLNPSPKQKASVTLTKERDTQNYVAQNSIEKVQREPKIVGIEPPSPPFNVEVQTTVQVPVSQEDNAIASIEFKKGKPTESAQDEVASIEYKPNQSKKPTLSEQIYKFRNSEINLPSIGDAKENLFALLSHNK